MNALTTFSLDGKNPADLVWPPTLPIELALKTATPDELRIEYGYGLDEWMALSRNPVFLRDLTQACELVRQEGMSFKLKAKLIAEENLKVVFQMIHDNTDKQPPAVVKAKLAELCARWAGYDDRWSGDGGKGGPVNANTLNIQINLSGNYA